MTLTLYGAYINDRISVIPTDRHCGLDPPVHRDENDKVAHLSAVSRESRRDSSETRQSRGAMAGLTTRQADTRPSFPRRRESTGRQERVAVILASRQYPQRGAPHAIHHHVIADLIRNPEGRTGGLTTRQARPVMLASRQYPHPTMPQHHPNPVNPL